MRFFIHGTPKPQARPRAVRRGRFSTVYSETTEWKEGCKYQASQIEGPCFGTAIEVNLYFQFHRPKSHYGTGKNADKLKASAPKHHVKKPDKDNLEKAVTDALVNAGLLEDDSIIIRGMTSKTYVTKGEDSGCWVEINQID
jgi:Holliday junction resolvase RusA-like endonuclease